MVKKNFAILALPVILLIQAPLTITEPHDRVRSAVETFQQPGLGHVARTINDKLTEHISVLDFGVIGDGIKDDTNAFKMACARAKALGGVLYIPSGVQILISSTVTIDQHGLIGALPKDPLKGLSNIKARGNFNALLIKGSRLLIENIGIDFQRESGSLATPAAVGFMFGDSVTQFSRSAVRNCFVRNAYDGFKTNNTALGTVWGNVFQSCNADYYSHYGFNFCAANGSTTQTFINCYGIRDKTAEISPGFAFFFSNITTVNCFDCYGDSALNGVISCINCPIFNLISFSVESCKLKSTDSSLIKLVNTNMVLGSLYVNGMEVDVGNGNRCYIIDCPSNPTCSTIIGLINMQYTRVHSGRIYDVVLRSAGKTFINNPTTTPSEVYGNGYELSACYNGRYIIPSSAYLNFGNWRTGDFVYNGSMVEAGVTGKKYVVQGWNRITTGSGNSIGIDWLEARTLTGN